MTTETKQVAPASLAAEQRPFVPGELIAGTYEDGESHTGKFTRIDCDGDVWLEELHTDAPWCFGPEHVRRLTAEPPPAKRPECDACGKESVFTFTQPGLSAVAAKGGAVHLCHRCGDEIADDEAARMIRERRKQLASGSAGSVQREQCESGSPALNRTEKPATEPVAPGRPSRDPYAEHRAKLSEKFIYLFPKDDLAVAAIVASEQAKRDGRRANKQRQAAEQLLRPATEKRYRGHPASWPEGAGEELYVS